MEESKCIWHSSPIYTMGCLLNDTLTIGLMHFIVPTRLWQWQNTNEANFSVGSQIYLKINNHKKCTYYKFYDILLHFYHILRGSSREQELILFTLSHFPNIKGMVNRIISEYGFWGSIFGYIIFAILIHPTVIFIYS